MKSLQSIFSIAIAFCMVCVVTTSYAQTPVQTQTTIMGETHIDPLVELTVTGGDVVFHVENKNQYKNGMEANGTTVKICATCDWKLKYDVHGPDVEAQGSDWAIKGMNGHYLPLGLIGMMIKPTDAAWFNAHVENNYATTKRLQKWDTMLTPKAGASNIGDDEKTKFKIWWSLGQSWTTSLLDAQVHADWYKFKVTLTLMCLH